MTLEETSMNECSQTSNEVCGVVVVVVNKSIMESTPSFH